MKEKQKVVILFGGRSVEHEVSLLSASNILKNIDRDIFEPITIGIDKNGSWLEGAIPEKKFSGNPVKIDFAAKTLHSSQGNITPDVVFPILHGTDGEDGSIQGLFRVLNIPLVGSGVLGSAVSMDKIFSKKLLISEGLPVSPYLYFNSSEKNEIIYEKIVTQLGNPFIIKPATLGSSVGVHKISSSEKLEYALKDVFQYDQNIIVEGFVKGREIECAVLGNTETRASFPGEIVVKSHYEFYTFEAKYVDGSAVDLVVPAPISQEIAQIIMDLSKKAYKALACEDYARVDLFLKDDGTVLINEVNTIPGFTNASMFPMMWANEGINNTKLISTLINSAVEKHKENNKLLVNFESDL